MRVLFALSGLHRVNRGAEAAFESVADEMAALPGMQVTLVGTGAPVPNRRYHYLRAGCVPRERFESWPSVPLLRNDCAYEELSFALPLLRAAKGERYDVTVTCGYPFTNWTLRAGWRRCGAAHVFVTQNGDWPARRQGLEFRFFRCDGLITLNPEAYERHRANWLTALIPNGVDPSLFTPGRGDRSALGLPERGRLALMVSALIESKHVADGVRCAARIPDLHLAVVGDGPLREQVDGIARELMPGRYSRFTVPRQRMPEVYRCADVLLHMSRDESFGNIYIESLATGIPVVAHDWPSTRWIFEDQGVLVDCGDPTAVVDGLCAALSSPPTEVSARRALVERRFTWRAIADQYRRFLTDVLARRTAAGAARSGRDGN